MVGEEDGVSVPPTSRAGLRNTINVCFSRLSSLQPSSCNFQVGKKKSMKSVMSSFFKWSC